MTSYGKLINGLSNPFQVLVEPKGTNSDKRHQRRTNTRSKKVQLDTNTSLKPSCAKKNTVVIHPRNQSDQLDQNQLSKQNIVPVLPEVSVPESVLEQEAVLQDAALEQDAVLPDTALEQEAVLPEIVPVHVQEVVHIPILNDPDDPDNPDDPEEEVPEQENLGQEELLAVAPIVPIAPIAPIANVVVKGNQILENLRKNKQKQQQMMQDLEKQEFELSERLKQYYTEREEWTITYGNISVNYLEKECANYRKLIETNMRNLENYRQEKEYYMDDLKDTACLCGTYDPEQKLTSSDTKRVDQQINEIMSLIAFYEHKMADIETVLIEINRGDDLNIQIGEAEEKFRKLKESLHPMRERMEKIKKLIMEEEQRPRYLAYAQKYCIEYDENDRFDLFRRCNLHHHWISHDNVAVYKKCCRTYTVVQCIGDFNSNYGIKREPCRCTHGDRWKCEEPVDDLTKFNLDTVHICG